MKQTDNRQNKLIQTKAQMKPFPKDASHAAEHTAQHDSIPGPQHGGAVFGLVSNIFLATKIAQAAKHCHLAVHNFDKAEPLLLHAKSKLPRLVILDWDGCEAESFKFLKELSQSADLKSVPVIGYLSTSKINIKEEARRAGCLRVYGKSEFMRDLDELLARYAQ